MDQLTNKQKIIYNMRSDGKAFSEIANALGITKQAAHNCYQIARNKINGTKINRTKKSTTRDFFKNFSEKDFEKLTGLEKSRIKKICEGFSVKEIAESENVKEETIYASISIAKSKLLDQKPRQYTNHSNWCKNNKDKRNTYQNKYYQKHIEEKREYHKNYQKRLRDSAREKT